MTEPTRESLERAARLWTLPEHSHKEMDAALARSIAVEFDAVRAEERTHSESVSAWTQADTLLARVQTIVDEMLAANTDNYGLLASAKEHIVMARADLDADMK